MWALHNTHVALLIFKCKSNMAARPRWMNADEALAEIFMDRDSDLSDESDQESEDVWEHSENSSESDDEEENKSVGEDDSIHVSDSEGEEDNVRANNESKRRGIDFPSARMTTKRSYMVLQCLHQEK